MKKGMKYGLVIPGIFFLGIIFLVLLAALLVQTEPAKRKIARTAETRVNKIISGNLSIGKIEGNFFTRLSLQNVMVTMGEDTLAQIDEIKAKYNLWPLLRNTIDIHSAEIIHPRFFLKQVNDSVWNMQQIVKPGPDKPEPKPESTAFFNIKLPVFKLVDGFIRTEALDTIIPQHIKNLNSELSVFWTENQQQVQLKQFSFFTRKPDFNLNRLEFLLTQNDKFIEIQNFKIETAGNQLDGKAGFSPEQQTGEASLEIPALNLSEFSYFLPYLKFPATPNIKLKVEMAEYTTNATLQLEDQNQQITLQVSSANLSEFLFNSQETILSYTLDGKFANVDLAHWLGIPELPYTLNGNLGVTGRGIDPKTADIALTGELNNWVIQDKQLDKLIFDLSLNKGNLAGQLRGNGQFGSFGLNPAVQNLFGVPVYEIGFSTKNLDLERLTGIEDLNSNINLTANVNGKKFNPEKISASARINMLDSRFQHIQIDTLFTTATFLNQNLKFDTLRAKNQNVLLTAEGNYSFAAPSDLKLEAVFSGVEEFYAYLPDSGLQTSGTIQARLWGQPDDLSLETSAELDSSRYGEISLTKLSLNATGRLTPTDTIFDAQVNAQQIKTGELLIDSVTAFAEGNLDSLFLSANLAARELTSYIEAGIIPDEPLKINLSMWEVDFKNQKWALQHPPAIIELGAQTYRIENFNMVSDHNEPEQFISSNGIISLTGEQDFHLQINGLNLENLMQLLEQEQPVTGHFGIQIDLKGKPDSLLLTSEFSISEPGFDKLKLKDISGKMEYADNRFLMETLVVPGDTGKIEMSAAFPLEINLDSMNIEFDMNDPVTGKINIDKISLAMLEDLEITDQLTGIFEGELDFSGTVESPVMSGNFALDDAEFSDYRFLQFNGNLNYSDNMFAADLNVVPQDSGKLAATVDIPLRFYPDSLKFGFVPNDSVNGNVIIDRLTLELLQAMYPAAKITGFVEAELNLSGRVESPNPEGNIRLRNASVQMPEYGIDYKNIGLTLNFLRDKVGVENLLVESSDGSLTGSGQMDFASDFYKGDISQSEIELIFNGFQPFNHRQFNMQVNGNATLGGKKGEVVYGGDLTIPRSEIFIPTVLRMLGRIYVPELPKPMLVEELEKMQQLKDSLFLTENQSVDTEAFRFDYFDNFKGNLRIRIPRNTWIKNNDMYIEISGDLELRKNYDFFELFGSVDVVRGQYDLLGKTFMVDEGSISFQGGEEMMPHLDIKASYSFRNQQRVEQNLSVQITGTAESPEVVFQLDGSSVSEGDALSYILFGKSMNELTIDEQDNMAGANGGNLAGRAAASILTSQLTNFLGEKLAVDYIEVKSDGGFNNATVVVGKYITNDLFVSYEQRFGETHEKDMVKYEVKLEYELFRFLFFELNNSSRASGFDVIFKFDVK